MVTTAASLVEIIASERSTATSKALLGIYWAHGPCGSLIWRRLGLIVIILCLRACRRCIGLLRLLVALWILPSRLSAFFSYKYVTALTVEVSIAVDHPSSLVQQNKVTELVVNHDKSPGSFGAVVIEKIGEDQLAVADCIA